MTTQEKITNKVKTMLEVCADRLSKQIIEVLTSGGTFTEAVANTQEVVNTLGIEVLQLICKEVDDVFDAQRDRHQTIIKHRCKTRSLLTSMGEITLKRKLYLDKSRQRFFFAVDEFLGLEKNSRIEQNMKAELIKNATLTSYGKASELASNKVSRQTVHNLVKKVRASETAPTVRSGRSEVANIYIEADEDHIHLQNGKCAEVKLVYVHEGVRQVCKGRTELENVRYFVSAEDDPDKIWNDVAMYLYKTYSLRNAQIHVSGDGAYWIKYSKNILPRAEYHIDKFHIQKSATIIAKGEHHVKRQILQAMRTRDVEWLSDIYKQQYLKYTNQTEKRAIADSYFYLKNNIETYSAQNRCSAEGHVSHVLSARMSSRPMGWSMAGAERIARLRAYYFNRGDFTQLVAAAGAELYLNCEKTLEIRKKYNTVIIPQSDEEYFQEPAHVVGIDGLTDDLSIKLRKILKFC